MSKLRSVNTHFWSDNFIIELDPIEKLLFLYLLTNEKTNMLGIYEIHLRRISFDTGIDSNMLMKIFDRFESAKKAKYCEGFAILPNFLKNQKFNANMRISAINAWNELPISVRNEDLAKPIGKGLKAFAKDSEPMPKIEVESEREKEGEPSSKNEVIDSFDEFYKRYKKRKDKKKALSAWKNMSKKNREKALAVVDDYVKSTPDENYRKYPSTWLNGECWNDEIDQVSESSKQPTSEEELAKLGIYPNGGGRYT